MSGSPSHSAVTPGAAESAMRHLLLIQPIAPSAVGIDDHVRCVSGITGLDEYSARQKLVGSALDVLKVGEDEGALREMRDSLRGQGFRVALVSAGSLPRSRRMPRAVKAVCASGTLGFRDIRDEAIIELAPGDEASIIVGSLDPGAYGTNKNLLRQLYGVEADRETSLARRLSELSKAQPALCVFPLGAGVPFYLIGGKFNYASMGERAKLSVSQNFLELMNLLRENTESEINTDFGLKALPIIPLAGNAGSSSDVLRKFLFYARLIELARSDGMYSGGETPLRRTPALDAVTGVLLSGAVLGGVGAAHTGNTQAGAAPASATHASGPGNTSRGHTAEVTEDINLPPPPTYATGLAGDVRRFGAFYAQLRILGPAPLALVLIASTGLALFLTFKSGVQLDIAWSLLPAGVLALLATLTMFQRKRVAQNTPTSKLRSLQMGTVEICGRAKRKYALQSPHSMVRCVYYRYRVLKKQIRHTSEGVATEQWVVVDRGDSGPVPFYLEDDTGQALIDPQGAIMSGLQTEEFSGSMADLLSGAALDRTRKVIETVIPEGASLYILGHARPLKNSAQDQQQEYRRRLKALKRSPDKLAKYDADRDGEISMEEWAVARQDIESGLLVEKLRADNMTDTAVVGEHPGGGLFFISDRPERELIAGYLWKIPLVGALGCGLTLAALIRLLS
ncbi:MAG: hypothetical protein ACE5GA_01135 [Candidatus Zixiibacteriota bacterium]